MPMEASDAGKETEPRAVQPEKAFWPTEVSAVPDRSADCRDAQLEKASWPMEASDAGKVAVFRDLQL